MRASQVSSSSGESPKASGEIYFSRTSQLPKLMPRILSSAAIVVYSFFCEMAERTGLAVDAPPYNPILRYNPLFVNFAPCLRSCTTGDCVGRKMSLHNEAQMSILLGKAGPSRGGRFSAQEGGRPCDSCRLRPEICGAHRTLHRLQHQHHERAGHHHCQPQPGAHRHLPRDSLPDDPLQPGDFLGLQGGTPCWVCRTGSICWCTTARSPSPWWGSPGSPTRCGRSP